MIEVHKKITGYTGCTVHGVTAVMDEGPVIIHSRPVPIYEGDTVESLHARIQEQEKEIYPLALHLFCEELNKQGS